MVETALAFGSNIGDKAANIELAIAVLDGKSGLSLTKRSALYKTPPWGVTDQDWFLNACALFETNLDAPALLTLCKSVEADLGREDSIRWGPRLIDIDILTFGARAWTSASLTIPHPRMRERAFVLVPLNEIAPDLDIGGISVRRALEASDAAGIEPYKAAPDRHV